jgi:hypothetical protein
MNKIRLFGVLLILLLIQFSLAIRVNSQIPSVYDSLKIIEKVYIQTDRTCYYPGDDIWFKAYLIEASNRILSNHICNLHIELISPLSIIIISRVIKLDGGLGNGDFKLPVDIKAGRYRIRAYTNYMRNFSDHLFFNKEIVVINPTGTKDEITDVIKYLENKIDIRFFPEGGSLVDNVSSVVAFKAVNATGKGCDVSGEVYCSTGELITAFKSDHLGMGSFFLRSAPGLNYSSIVKDTNGIENRSEIPKSFPTGVTLSASINRDNKLLIKIRTNAQTLPLVLDQDLRLSFSARKETLKTVSFKLKSYNNSFILPTDDLPDGIVMLTLSTLENLPLAERLIYIEKDNKFKISIESDKQVYNQRDSVTIRISFSSGSDIPEDGFLSLSAVEKSFTDNSSQYPSTISSWFLLESDIHGPVEEPSYYFDPTNGDRMRDLDLLLLTQGWRDFEWKYDKLKYPPEIGFTVSGRLRKINVDQPLEASMVNIGIFDNKSSLVRIIPVDSSGRFRLARIDLTGEGRLIVSAIGKKGHLQGLVLLDSLKYIPAEVSDSMPRLKVLPEEDVTTFEQEFEIKEAIRKKYKLSDTINLGEVTVTAKKTRTFQEAHIESVRVLYGKPDNEVVLTPQLASSKNVFEVLNGRVPGVHIEGNLISIRGRLTRLILIDGIQHSYFDLLNTPVSIIDRIDVLKSAGTTGIFGVQADGGVISIITKRGEYFSLPPRPILHSVNTQIKGYDTARIFYSPRHSPSSNYQPDLRTTLFWEPNIELQSDKNLFLKYFNADNSSTIRVILEGITTTGIPITARTEYEIK